MIWPEKIKELHVSVGGQTTASLLKQSVFKLVYESTARRCVGLGLPPSERVFQDGDLFAALDMNLPEGYLFDRILDRFPEFALSKMHLLALMARAASVGWVTHCPVRRLLRRQSACRGKTCCKANEVRRCSMR